MNLDQACGWMESHPGQYVGASKVPGARYWFSDYYGTLRVLYADAKHSYPFTVGEASENERKSVYELKT